MNNNLANLVEQMVGADAFRKVLFNRMAQFGRPRREYLGARFLPERLVPDNKFTEGEIKFRSPIALDTSRYSPPVKRGNMIVGTFDVSLSDQDVAADFTAEDYDNMVKVAHLQMGSENSSNPEMQAMTVLTNWFDAFINVPLIEKMELMRWQAIVDSVVQLRGANGYSEDIQLADPAGHRSAAATDWSDPTVNPLLEIFDKANVLADEGYTLGAWITGRPVINTLLRNPKVQSAVGGFISVSGATLQSNNPLINQSQLNQYLGQNGLPPIIEYNAMYRNQEEATHFLKRDVLVGLALTGRDQIIDLGDEEPLPMADTLGYFAVGRAAGQASPGRASFQDYKGDKPPRLEAQGWQTSFPVIQDPSAIVTIHTINTV